MRDAVFHENAILKTPCFGAPPLVMLMSTSKRGGESNQHSHRRLPMPTTSPGWPQATSRPPHENIPRHPFSTHSAAPHTSLDWLHDAQPKLVSKRHSVTERCTLRVTEHGGDILPVNRRTHDGVDQ